MAHAATTNFYVHPVGTTFNVQFKDSTISTMRSYNYAQIQDIMSTRQANFAFIFTVLLNFLQIKYQGKDESPFETHPKTTLLAIAGLLTYCLCYDAKLRITRNPHHHHHPNPSSASNSYTFYFVHSSMAFFGPLSLASTLSILLPELLSPLVFSLAILFTVFQFPPSLFRTISNRLKAVIMNKFCLQPQRTRTTAGVARFISVRLPWILEHTIIDQIDLTPV